MTDERKDQLTAEADGVFDLNDMRHYKLYKRKEP